jgi:hypothetical protein
VIQRNTLIGLRRLLYAGQSHLVIWVRDTHWSEGATIKVGKSESPAQPANASEIVPAFVGTCWAMAVCVVLGRF